MTDRHHPGAQLGRGDDGPSEQVGGADQGGADQESGGRAGQPGDRGHQAA